MERIDRALVAEIYAQVCHPSVHFSNVYVFLHAPNQDEHKTNNNAYKNGRQTSAPMSLY